jgi:hypothetical protein
MNARAVHRCFQPVPDLFDKVLRAHGQDRQKLVPIPAPEEICGSKHFLHRVSEHAQNRPHRLMTMSGPKQLQSIGLNQQNAEGETVRREQIHLPAQV